MNDALRYFEAVAGDHTYQKGHADGIHGSTSPPNTLCRRRQLNPVPLVSLNLEHDSLCVELLHSCVQDTEKQRKTVLRRPGGARHGLQQPGGDNFGFLHIPYLVHACTTVATVD